MQYEYAIIPISFRNYKDYVYILNEEGKEGWIFGAMIREYKNTDWEEIGTPSSRLAIP